MNQLNFTSIILILLCILILIYLFNIVETFSNNNISTSENIIGVNNNLQPVNNHPPFYNTGINTWKKEFDIGMDYYIMKHGYLNPYVHYNPRYTLSGNFLYKQPESLVY